MAASLTDPPSASKPAREKKKGFSVGPDNLPDGVHRRKGIICLVQKIKKSLIRKAQLKKSYSKLKSREPESDSVTSAFAPGAEEREEAPHAASVELHPDRQAMLDEPEPASLPLQSHIKNRQINHQHLRPPRPVPFKKESQLAQQRREEQEARREAFERATEEREVKREQRERFRKAMAKARSGGRHGGQRKLGRESKVLLEKVQMMVRK